LKLATVVVAMMVAQATVVPGRQVAITIDICPEAVTADGAERGA
jgi:hypothetical protein